MSRTIKYNINRFDGGITHDIRNTTDLSKCAHVSHFDIYTDKNRLIPMPGYVNDMNDGSTATGMQQYAVRAFDASNGVIYAIGMKSSGTGSKIFSKATPTTSAWTALAEGTNDLSDATFLKTANSGRTWFVTEDGGQLELSYYSGGTITDNAATLQATSGWETPLVTELAFDDAHYSTNGKQDVDKIAASSHTDAIKSTLGRPMDLQSGDEVLGIFQHRAANAQALRASLLLWDTASSLADQKVDFGWGKAAALGYPSGVWVGVVNKNLTTDSTYGFDNLENGRYGFVVKYVGGAGSARTLVRVDGKSNTNGAIRALRSNYKDAMLFYAKVPTDATPTTYKQGIWAVGRGTDSSPFALSLLMDTTDLGTLEGFYGVGDHYWFAHNSDGSISRLDAFDGTYDVACTYESLMFGSDTPTDKQLNGITVTTENLPSGGSVVVKYRTDEDSAWTTLGTSSTEGQTRHTFTRTSAGQVGSFYEIQFQVIVTGYAPIKNIHISLQDTDSLPYDA